MSPIQPASPCGKAWSPAPLEGSVEQSSAFLLPAREVQSRGCFSPVHLMTQAKRHQRGAKPGNPWLPLI